MPAIPPLVVTVGARGAVELTVLRGICFIYHKKCGVVLTLA